MAVFDALKAAQTVPPQLTVQDLMKATGMTYWQVKHALDENEGNIECFKAPRYGLTPTAKRPTDRRGRKRNQPT